MATTLQKEKITERAKLQLSPNAKVVLNKRYLVKNQSGEVIEEPEDMFWRVCRNVAQADLLYNPEVDVEKVAEEFYLLLSSLQFMPNSPTLMNAGRELQQLSACFVLPIEDSMDSIFETLKETAMIHKSGGGTGFSFNRLRPRNDMVQSTKGVSSGPVSFMQVFNAATEAIKQGGTRRGANMGILSVDHPNIIEFIKCKDNNSAITNFNISVGITSEFMNAVAEDREYALRNPRTKEPVGKLKASEVFDLIVDQAWKNGEPGIIFFDNLNKDNPTPKLGEIESTNPCGEQPLLPYESCNLGSINLGKMVVGINGSADVDWEHLAYVAKTAVHFLDNIIDVNKFPIKKIEKMTKSNRKIGLGVMGWADMLAQLRIPYASERALALSEKIMNFIRENARAKSKELSDQRGPFPNFKDSIYSQGSGMRNATVTTIAPTGTIGIISNASGGVEPFFSLVYTRANVLDNDELLEVNPYFEQVCKEKGIYSKELMKEVSKHGSIQNIDSIPQDIKDAFQVSHDISPEWHVKMQAAFQKYTDNAVSKTVNFPNSATKEDIAKVYKMAHRTGCKGVTVYRDGSREQQVLNVGIGVKNKKEEEEEAKKLSRRVRPKITLGSTLKMVTGCGNMYVTINEDENGPCELFTQLGKSGGCIASQAEAVGRLVSLALRSNIKFEQIIGQLKGIRCPSPTLGEGGAVLSCADAIAKAIEAYLKEKDNPGLFTAKTASNKNPGAAKVKKEYVGTCPECPECGGMLEFCEGCVTCRSCGFSRCY
ncbi:MAG: vitamin B12-dependent ribonucleotide reductase [bacterium]